MAYKEEDYLLLSGIQHFVFCPRQWALIHIEQQWKDNYKTADGQVMHRNAHDTGSHTRRGDVLTIRGLKIHSPSLGISGECDVVEFHKDSRGISLQGETGLWLPYPVEYKRGKRKEDDCDILQLCAQAMCLEEMLCCKAPEGALFYGEEKRRLVVRFDDSLRKRVSEITKEMHQIYSRGYTPKVKPKNGCNSCSLKDLCLPKLMKKPSVSTYLAEKLGED